MIICNLCCLYDVIFQRFRPRHHRQRCLHSLQPEGEARNRRVQDDHVGFFPVNSSIKTERFHLHLNIFYEPCFNNHRL